METELTLDEQTLLAIFRTLDDHGKKELLRHASVQHKIDETVSATAFPGGQCKLQRREERPETVTEPVFTE